MEAFSEQATRTYPVAMLLESDGERGISTNYFREGLRTAQ